MTDRLMPLTPRQREALVWIEGYMDEHDGIAPSYREIRRGLGVKSTANVHGLIRSLVVKGWITSPIGGRRNIVLNHRSDGGCAIGPAARERLRQIATDTLACRITTPQMALRIFELLGETPVDHA